MSRHLAALTCTSLTLALAACGGGDGAVGTPGVAPAAATPSTVAPTLPASATWAVAGAADGIAAGSYTQSFDPFNFSAEPSDSAEGQVGNIVRVEPLLTVKGAADDANPNAQVTLSFDVDTPTKYLVSVLTATGATFACLNGYDSATLAKIATLQSALEGLTQCTGTLTINVANRSYQSTGLTLTRTGKAGDTSKMVLQVNHRWPLGFQTTVDKITKESETKPYYDPLPPEQTANEG
jgi:hypothetical protein